MRAFALFVTGIFAVVTLSQAPRADEPNWHLQVVLVDGSRIIGVPATKSLNVDVGFSEMRIPFERIRRVDFQDHGNKIRLELNNEDIFSGTIKRESIEIETIFGKVALQMKHLKAIEVRPTNQLTWLPTTRGLALYYSFDRVGDGVVTNLASDKHIGKLNGSKWIKEGYRGGAIKFNRSTQIEVPHDPDLCPQTMTLAAWLKPHGDQSSYQVIVGKTAASSWNEGYAFVRMPGNDKMVYFFVNGYTESAAKTEIPLNEWSHVAGVCDGKNVTIFLNGIAMDSVPMRRISNSMPGEEAPPDSGDETELACHKTDAVTEATIRHSEAPLFIGSDTRGYTWNGTIDELVLYRRALSATELKQLYETTSSLR